MRALLTAVVLSLLAAGLAACGGASKVDIKYPPGQSGPTSIQTPDGRVSAVIPEGAASELVRIIVVNRSESDAEVPGPEGRSLLMAVELEAISLAPPSTDSGGTDSGGTGGTGGTAGTGGATATPLLSAPVDITLHLQSAIPGGGSLPLYKYNAVSGRYEDAGAAAAVADDGLSASFSTDTPARYAVYGLLQSEFPPPPPSGLQLLDATTLVRKLGWNAASGVLGYNLYRSPLGEDSFSKVNTELLTATSYSDQLTQPGGYAYAVSAVAPDALGEPGLESELSAPVQSPAIVFDLAFTFGSDRLEYPYALALDSAGGRLFIADPGVNPTLTSHGQIWVYALDGGYMGRIDGYSEISAVTPRGICFDPVNDRLYVADAGRDFVYLLDAGAAGYPRRGRFGSTGSGPGEFLAPFCVARLGDKLIVGDRANSQLQSFTPLGVYLSTFATLGALNGQVEGPRCLLALSSGKLAIADDGNNRVQIYSELLEYEATVILPTSSGGPLSGVSGLAEDQQEQLYVSDSQNRRVAVFDSSGAFLFHFGSEGSLRVEFGLEGPAGLACDLATGLLYVADPSNQRIAVFGT